MLHYIFRGNDAPGFFVQAYGLGGNRDMLDIAPGNVPPAEGPYLCIVPVLDAWRAVQKLARLSNVAYFGDHIEPAVLADIRTGRAMIVLDMSNEGPAFHADIFGDLHRFAIENRLPITRLVWLAQNRAAGAAYVRTFSLPASEGIQFEYYDFFVKNTAWMFAPQSRRQVLGVDPEAHIARLFEFAAKDRLLLCLNATPRVHRVVTIGGLIHHGLFDPALVSFPGLSHAKDGDVGDASGVAAFLSANPGLAYLQDGCTAAMALEALRVDNFSETGNALHDKIDVRPYERTYFSLVTETEFTAGAVDRVTEKLIKAFCLGHPTMVVGNPNALHFVTELGLRDFSPMIPSDYDREPDPARRMGMLFDQALSVAAAIRQDPAGWLESVREIGAHNARLASSGGLLDAYVAKYDRPLVERLGRRLATI